MPSIVLTVFGFVLSAAAAVVVLAAAPGRDELASVERRSAEIRAFHDRQAAYADEVMKQLQ